MTTKTTEIESIPQANCKTPSCACVSLRVHLAQSLSENRFEELLAMLKNHRGFVDELAFFTHSIHPVEPLAMLEPVLEMLTKRMQRAREEGYRAGLNFLSTLGHIDEYLHYGLKGGFTRMTGINGLQAEGSFCPNDTNYQMFLRRVFTRLANTKPDFIWTDDDVQMGGHMGGLPGKLPCFCANCVRLFNEANGTTHTRESLHIAFDEGSRDEKKKIRRAWILQNGISIHKLLSLVEETIHSIRPGIPLGRMQHNLFYEGYDLIGDVQALSGSGQVPVKFRPGGGGYPNPADIGRQTLAIGRHVGFIPDDVVDIQTEIEHWPYEPLSVNASITVLQTAAFIAAGSTGAAYNILKVHDEPFEEFEPMVRELTRGRPFYDLLVRTLDRRHPKGIFPGWNRFSMVGDNLAGGPWGEGGSNKAISENPLQIFGMGLPPAFTVDDANVTLLSGDLVLSLEQNDIERILAGGVYLDGTALTRLNELGFASLTGFTVDAWVEKNCAEIMSDHPLNGATVGRRRDCIQSFWPNPCAVLSGLDSGSQILARKIERSGVMPSFACMGAFENRLGGRVVVAGYSPWTYLQSKAKTIQIKKLFRWLSRDTLPGYVESFHNMLVWIRELGDGRMAAVLVNTSQDPATDVTLLLRTAASTATTTSMDMKETKLESVSSEGGYSGFVIPSMHPWQILLLMT